MFLATAVMEKAASAQAANPVHTGVSPFDFLAASCTVHDALACCGFTFSFFDVSVTAAIAGADTAEAVPVALKVRTGVQVVALQLFSRWVGCHYLVEPASSHVVFPGVVLLQRWHPCLGRVVVPWKRRHCCPWPAVGDAAPGGAALERQVTGVPRP